MDKNKSKLDSCLENYVLFPKLDVVNICLIGVFSALCYVVLVYKIPLPTVSGSNASVHLGNMLVMLISVLFSGFTGGLSGAIGMGLFDILNGYASSSAKTIILKLGIGLITGLVFYILNKKNKKVFVPLLISTIFFFVIASVCLGFSISAHGGQLLIQATGKTVNMFWATYAFSYLIAIFSLVALIASSKIQKQLQYVLVATTCGFIFNLFGEFIYALVKQCLLGSDFITGLVYALAKMPATIINGTISITIVVAIYGPLRLAMGERKHHGLSRNKNSEAK